MSKKLNIVFMGTPPFAAHILEQLLAYDGCKVSAVYCQPDRPAGRGKKLVSPAVKVFAEENNIPVYQPRNFKEQSQRDELAALQPDILVVAAYGLILPQAVLDIPRLAPINVHASLLPFYRGAAPIQRAIMDNQAVTGVCIMRMEAGLDTGPVYSRQSVYIRDHTSDSLHEALADLGAKVLVEVLQEFLEKGSMDSVTQLDEAATYAAKMCKEDGLIQWDARAQHVHAQIRGVTSWPGAQARLLRPEKEICDIKLGPGQIGPDLLDGSQNSEDATIPLCGEVWRLEDGTIAVATRDNWYILQTVRPNNKKEMSAEAFANGYLKKGFGLLATMQGI